MRSSAIRTLDIRAIRALLCASLLAGASGAAADAGAPSSYTIESDVHRFVVERDGRVEEYDDTTLRADTSAGVDAIAQYYIWFDKESEQLALLTAESIDPDGRVYPVAPDAIRDVQEPRSAGAPMFSNGVLRTVIFPGVEPEWRVRVVFRKTRTKPAHRGAFNYFVEPARVPVDHQQLIFDLPADMPLRADARGYAASAPVTENGRTRYTFDYRHGPYAPIEPGAVGYAQYGDRLMVTTVPGYAAFAERYRVDALDPTGNDARVVALARALTADAPDASMKARILYDWVRANIRYVALFVGETAARPHRVVDVLTNRYGDCKDHVALFGALLAAVGIRSEPALLGLGPVYALPEVPGYGTAAINHVIVWIPSLRLFADTTAGGTAFGDLPPSVMDRPALLVEQGVLTRTPATQPRGRDARLRIEVDSRGAGRYAYRVQDSGWTAETERNMFRRATRARVQQIAYERLRKSGLRGTATLVTDDVAATSGPFAVSMSGTLEHVVWPDGMTGVPALSSLSGGIAGQVEQWLAASPRTQPFVCLGGRFDEVGHIALPAGLRLVYLPDDLTVSAPELTYRSGYIYDSSTRIVQISRHLQADFGKQVCSPADFAALSASLQRIERDAFAQIIVRGAPLAGQPAPSLGSSAAPLPQRPGRASDRGA